MSFSKAKIHRFNDEAPCAPPPGAYNPVLIDKTVGPRINKTERFSISGKIIHASSSESLNSLHSEKGTACIGSFATFKTPRIPSTYRSICHTDIRKNVKAVSIDALNKKSANDDYEINFLRYSLNMIQEELTMEKDRNQKLVNEINELKNDSSETDWYSEWLFDIIVEKEKWIDLLNEKCLTLQRFADEYIKAHQNFVNDNYVILEQYLQMSAQSDSNLHGVLEHYEKLICERDLNLETVLSLFDTLQKLQCINLDQNQLEKLTTQHSDLLNKLQETEKQRRIFEFRLEQQKEVIDILRNRINESDEAADSLLKVVQGFAKGEGTAEYIEYTQKNLLKLVEDYKNQAVSEKKSYEKSIKEKDAIISGLKSEKDSIELQLQESLDQIEILKCKEQLVENEYGQKIGQFERTLKNYQQHLQEWEKSKKSSSIMECPELVSNLMEFLSQSHIHMITDDSKLAAETFQTQFVQMLDSTLSNPNTNRTAYLQRFLECVMQAFTKISSEVVSFKNDLIRVRDDFIEKCDECGQLTRLLQMSERYVDDSEKLNNRLVCSQNEWEIKFAEQAKQIGDLQKINIEFREKLANTQDKLNESEKDVISLNQQLTHARDELNTKSLENTEIALKEALLKIQTIEKEKLLLLQRVAVLEKLESETKQLKENSNVLMQKPSKSQSSKNKQVMKLRNEICIVKKKHEGSASKSLVKAAGKENKLVVKAKDLPDLKKAAAVELPVVNATYIVTSPKINRV